ncbi:MAG: zinc-dependent alcohol dehydrogenase family protein [Candidatus Eisenbacteria bacterium]|uniref:alcohol dehydrogenase n=1 Tax=Eiseniibacteriota bacterium TaxID=2212470 RepID=A0A948RYI8_UNCEI|nr:zinc-dependent alcohol dehydrogenase family protein [Candidatus Eisenbacteria bacterium]MBU1950335.1 zinc-dependent alcohol dehydrogenase family protein [Candidatus Eisenbacteria bacterium]MBU2693195.1 zinc-dependent alcohol dehydrogenase family protein [Candidatus Eisenbacteria bacterium]
MRAMVLESPCKPLIMKEISDPVPETGQVLVKVHACGICRTDLHIVDGELPDLGRPVIPGHQVVGRVVGVGSGVNDLSEGDRVGLPWLGWTCGRCDDCSNGRENLCDQAKFHGYQLNGGFAEKVCADARYAFPIPDGYPDLQAAPLLCGGLIGYRAYRMAGEGKRLGFYGFGSAAHILIQLARYEGREVYAFTRSGDEERQNFARRLGAVWAGSSDDIPPERLDAAILFAPVGALVPRSLEHVRKGGRVVSAGIYMSDIPSFPYKILWGERSVHSVANLTRQDGVEFLKLAPRVPVQTEVSTYPLEEANRALDDLRHGRFNGSAVLVL